MKKVLITGAQGSGKTAVAQLLASRGYATVDGDDFAQWVDAQNRPLADPRPERPSTTWLESHYWNWQPDKLESLLANETDGPQIICGMSYDQYQYYSLFDQIILLEADAATIRQRLKSRTNASFGKQAAELKFILSHLDDLQSTALAAGAVAIDATRPLETVADCVTEALA